MSVEDKGLARQGPASPREARTASASINTQMMGVVACEYLDAVFSFSSFITIQN
jgi:hypothetical protein